MIVGVFLGSMCVLILRNHVPYSVFNVKDNNKYSPRKMISLSDEKKKTKSIDSELNPVWNEVNLHYTHTQTCIYRCLTLFFLTRSAAKERRNN